MGSFNIQKGVYKDTSRIKKHPKLEVTLAASDSGVYEVTAGGYRRLVEKGYKLIDDVRDIGHRPAGISPFLSRVVANRRCTA